MAAQRDRFWLGKLQTRIERRLTWLPQIAFVFVLALAFAFAPAVDSKHSPDRLTNLFIGVFTVLAGLSIGLVLFQRNAENRSALRFLGGATITYVVLGISTAVGGVLPLNDRAYRYLFAASTAGLAAVLSTTALVAVASIRGQKKGADDAKLDDIAQLQEAAKKKCPEEECNPAPDV